MMWLPMLLVVQVHKPDERRINLWLPLFLLWLLLLGLVLLLSPLLIIALCCLLQLPQGRTLLRMIGQGYATCCALRGLRVDVRQGAETVKIICF